MESCKPQATSCKLKPLDAFYRACGLGLAACGFLRFPFVRWGYPLHSSDYNMWYVLPWRSPPSAGWLVPVLRHRGGVCVAPLAPSVARQSSAQGASGLPSGRFHLPIRPLQVVPKGRPYCRCTSMRARRRRLANRTQSETSVRTDDNPQPVVATGVKGIPPSCHS